MPWHIGTQTQCRNAVARLNTALGYPRTATDADRLGGGVHVPLAEVQADLAEIQPIDYLAPRLIVVAT